MTENKIKKVVIFCGGKGTRLAEMTSDMPKPMVPINGDPIVLHIMRKFYAQGYTHFVLALGYKSQQFKTFFRDYTFRGKDMTIHPLGTKVYDHDAAENWTIDLVETGPNATTGQRLNAVRKYIGNDDFFLTYGDSVSDVDLLEVEKAHYNYGTVATITSVPLQEKFGIVRVGPDGIVEKFAEKSDNESNFINGGFIACKNELLQHVHNDSKDFSFETLTRLGDEGLLGSYTHRGFWHAMDSKKDHDDLEEIFEKSPELFGY